LKQYAHFSELQHDLFQGATTCVEQVALHGEAIQQKQHLNAFVEVYTAEAMQRAEAIDQKIKNKTAGKLAGLVIGLKDVLCHEGHRLQACSRMLEGFVSQFTGTAVQRLLDEDAIVIGRQNCDEFAMGSSNENSAFGAVKHALDEARVPGGSSGGSAVAVMANMCRVSIGSDTGGSVRQPAAFCGVVGLKPTYARISRHGLVAYASSFDCIGIFSKSVRDVACVLEVMAGADEVDSTVSRQPVPAYANVIDTTQSSYRIAYLRDALESDSLQPAVREAVKRQLDVFRAKGWVVEPIALPLNEYVLPTYYILATAEASSNLSRYDGVRYGYRSPAAHDLASLYKKSRAEGFGKEVQRRILLGTYVLSASYYDAYYAQAQKVRRLIRQEIKNVFATYDFLVMPTAPTTAFLRGQHRDNPVEMYLADLFSVQANVAGVPAISIPCGVDESGLPIGLQLVADDFRESELLQFANLALNLQQKTA
jgi:aspartyl-tRNA(Asn)/glutamyl-tRNA(Gln) amidotransferase subunit A